MSTIQFVSGPAGKRAFLTLIPTMLPRDGKPYLAFETIGGENRRQPQAAMATSVIVLRYAGRRAIQTPLDYSESG